MDKNEEYMDEALKKEKKQGSSELQKLEVISKEKLQKTKKTKVQLTVKIKEMLLYVGFFFALIGGFSYIIVTWVLIKGFNASLELDNQILFSVISALIGLSISFALRNQGIALAKKESESIAVMKDYYETLNKTKSMKQLHTITYYLIRATIIDILIKGVITALSMWFMLSIFIGGDDNYGLVGLALANLLLFTGFGLIALSGAYDRYIDNHIPVIAQRTKILKKEIAKKIEDERLLVIAKEKKRLQLEKELKEKLKAKTAKKKPVKKKKA